MNECDLSSCLFVHLMNENELLLNDSRTICLKFSLTLFKKNLVADF